MNAEKKLLSTSIITAVAASFCCIAPVVAFVAGSSGVVSTISWIEPFRPFLIALTVLVLGLAWYQKFRLKKQPIDCECDDEKPKFINSKQFLFFVTVFAAIMLAFPYYAKIFYPYRNIQVAVVEQTNVHELNYKIQGMTCLGCEAHVESEIHQLDGIFVVKASFEKSTALVKYDKTIVSEKEIDEAILKTGYKIID